MIGISAEPVHEPRLLILEDEPALRETLTAIFEEEGFEVVGVASAESGFRILQEGRHFCASVVDLRLQDMRDEDLLNHLEPYTDGIPMVIHTAYSSYETAKRAINSGAFAYVEKAGEPRELVYQVQRAVQSHLGRYTRELERAVADRTRSLQQTQDHLLKHQRQLKALVSELTLTEERLRRTLATELHDHVCQSLAISKARLEQLTQKTAEPRTRGELGVISEILDMTLIESRSMTSRLSYPALTVLGLEKAVEKWLLDEVQQKHGVATQFSTDHQEKPLDEDVRAVLFRGIRELLTNAIKHGRPTNVRVSLERRREEFVAVIEDDGRGQDPEQMVGAGDGFGLLSLQEALGTLGGHLSVTSRPGQGCLVSLHAPIAGS